MAKILIVEDDRVLSKMLSDYLTLEQHIVEAVFTGTSGLENLRFYKYDLIILDWDLPEMSGLTVCREFRDKGGNTPILFLTGKHGLSDKELGFDSGADDYLTKPFHIRELSARIKALLRRPEHLNADALTWNNVVLESSTGRVTKDGAEVKLLPKEFALLEFLLRHPDQLFSPDALLDRVWTSSSDSTSEAVTTCVKRIRKKLDTQDRPSIITTVHGVGYKLMQPPKVTSSEAKS